MKFLFVVAVVFCCSIFAMQKPSSVKLIDESQAEISKISVNSSPTACAAHTTFINDELPSKGLAFYEAGDKFLSVFVQVDLPDDGKAYYLKGGSVKITGQKHEKATTFQAEQVLSSNVIRVKVPVENVHAKLLIDQMKNQVAGLGNGSATLETGNRTPDKVEGQDGLKLGIKLELESVKEK